jgi:hypothetical protein
MQLSNQWWSAHLPMAGLVAPAVVLVVLWSVFWKGLALWHSRPWPVMVVSLR